MIGVKVTTDLRPLQQMSTTARNSPKLMQTAMRRNLSRAKTRILRRVKERDIAAPSHPLAMTPRQRRAYWATDGFGHGIPYRRTGGLQDAYDLQIQFDGTGGTVTLSNTAPGAEYVIGARQQSFLEQWENITVTNDYVADEVSDIAQETWFTVSDPFGGVPL